VFCSVLRALCRFRPGAAVLPFLLAAAALAGEGLVAVPASPSTLVNEQALLILNTGGTLGGRITQSPGGFIVHQPQGTIVVPFHLVEFTARDLRDALRKFHERTPNPTGGFHVSLAQWCLRHQLLSEARGELLSALKLQPHRQDARAMLRRLDEVLDPPTPPPAVESGNRPGRPRLRQAGFEVPEATSLAGLSRDAAREFTERVQPVLMNKCGNASCHGPAAGSEFRLARVRLTAASHRVHAERNLAVTLDYVDLEHPERSPLLVIPRGNHGRAGQTIFSGPAGDEQLGILREWVGRVAAERSVPRPDSTAARAPLAGTEDGLDNAPPLSFNAGGRDASPPDGPWPAPVDGLRDPHETDSDEPPDAFDPEAFNQLDGPEPKTAGVLPPTRGG
jgi:hypothetical protein